MRRVIRGHHMIGVFTLGVACLALAGAAPLPETGAGLPVPDDVRVSIHLTGGPQCLDDGEIRRTDSGLRRPDGTVVEPPRPKITKPEDIDAQLKESGITVLEKKEASLPVCAACYVCPKYDVQVEILIPRSDLSKALTLGFSEK